MFVLNDDQNVSSAINLYNLTLMIETNKAFHSDRRLYQEIMEMLSPSYQDASELLGREFELCNVLYTMRSESNLLCFFMVGWNPIPVNGSFFPAVYLGLSGSSEKGTGTIRALYGNLNSDACKWEQEHGRELILCFTTATASACFAGHDIFANGEPSRDGSFTETGAMIARALKTYRRIDPTGNPFVWPRAAGSTRYSAQESERIRKVVEKHSFTLFQRLGINEAAGDRLLMVCRPRHKDQTVSAHNS